MDSFLSRHGAGEPGPGESLFTRIARSDRDQENLVLWRGETAFALLNLYPYNNGHTLLAPYRQVARYSELEDDERIEIARAIGMVISWIESALEPEGFNIGINDGPASGAGMPEHLHVHIVPRWSGDTNFMSSTADVKVVPQAIEETYRRILQSIDSA
jgi:ATP adenylyltransferase